MIKTVIILFTAVSLASCGGSGNNEEKSATSGTTDLSKNPDYQKGLELVAANKCMTCHQIDDKLTGPAYREVANKYAGMPDTIITHLAKKIITGGSGVWGEIFMTPHSGVSQADAETMVKYILLLKK